MTKTSPSLLRKKVQPQSTRLPKQKKPSVTALCHPWVSPARVAVSGPPAKHSPPLPNDPDELVPRELHPINVGRSKHFIGKIGKRYHRGDYVGPIVDSMGMMYARLGWTKRLTEAELDDRYPCWVQPSREASVHPCAQPTLQAASSSLSQAGPSEASKSLCSNCEEATSWNDFQVTDDKSHLCCGKCGAISKPLRVATDRERNCSRDEDKTTHADRPYDQDKDRFSKPGMLASERRRVAEREAAGTHVSKRAKERYGIGFAMERNNRQAASEQMERARNGMSTRDTNKGHQIIVELEKLFEPLEKINDAVKRYCRIEADRLWREAVRHAAVCCADGRCQYRLKEKPVAVIAQTSLVCSLNNLAQGMDTIEGVQHGHIVALNTKLRTIQQTAVSSGYRAVEQVVRRLAAHRGPEPVPVCPLPSATPSPAPSVSSTRSAMPPSVHASPVSIKSVPLNSSESSSDLEEAAELLQLRDAIGKVQRHLSCAPRIQRAALCAIQDAKFRAAALSEKLGSSELAYCILDAASVKLTGASLPASQRPGKLKIDRIASVASTLVKVLPATTDDSHATEEDGLF